jgi:hypothetical protein
VLVKKRKQQRGKHRRQDYSQDPNGLGMYVLGAGNDQEAGKPKHTRHGAHENRNKHADDNLLHNIPSIMQPAKARTTLLISASRNNLAFYKGILTIQLFYSGSGKAGVRC